MRLSRFHCLLIGALAGCQSLAPASQDSLAAMLARGGRVGPPVSTAEVESALERKWQLARSKGQIHSSVQQFELGHDWLAFTAKLQPGDELRAIDLPRGGQGYAIFRSGIVVDCYFTVIY